MASRALTIRFISDLLQLGGVHEDRPQLRGQAGGGIVDGRARRRNIASIGASVSAIDSRRGRVGCLRLKVSSCRVTPAALSTACSASPSSATAGEPARQLAAGDVDAGGNDREQVVEVVRDAGRHPPDRLQLLRLLQPRRQRRRARVRLLHRRDVASLGDDLHDLPARVPDRHQRKVDRAPLRRSRPCGWRRSGRTRRRRPAPATRAGAPAGRRRASTRASPTAAGPAPPAGRRRSSPAPRGSPPADRSVPLDEADQLKRLVEEGAEPSLADGQLLGPLLNLLFQQQPRLPQRAHVAQDQRSAQPPPAAVAQRRPARVVPAAAKAAGRRHLLLSRLVRCR